MDYTVLLAEDQKKLRDVVRDYFAAHGVTCDLARDGAESLPDGIHFRVELP